jgi:hypothetical protein
MKTIPKVARLAGLAFALSVCLLLPSCGGSSKAPALFGTVNYKGSPVTGGNITLYPTAGGPEYPIQIRPDGTYETSGVPLGTMSVSIETESIKGQTGGAASYKPPPGAKMVDKPPEIDNSGAPSYVKIPKKYSDPKTSGLSIEITKGRQMVNFDLTD